MSSTKDHHQLKLRVFAGPNGSGKSTVIKVVREYSVNGTSIDFGIYINADEIAVSLKNGDFSFDKYLLTTNDKEFQEIALESGLINDKFPETLFRSSYKFTDNKIILSNEKSVDRLAQIIADFLRKKLLLEKRRFSFETVFSHESKLEIMRAAKAEGYKVYLYFVSTVDPEINMQRVKSRVKQGGHYVPPELIESRYYRSLEFLYEACQIAYQVFFFDNSEEGSVSNMFAHFKVLKGKKNWDEIADYSKVPYWFEKYYSDKIKP